MILRIKSTCCFFTLKINIIILILGCIAINLYSQELKLRFNHLTTEEGLSQNTVNGIVKDKYGFMWFGTWGGLNRYDGYKFTIYNADTENPRALRSNRLLGVFKDSSETVWAMTTPDSAIVRYNYETDDFTRFSKKDFPPAFINAILPQRKTVAYNYEWKFVFNTIRQTNLKTNQVTHYVSNLFDRWSVHISNSYSQYVDNNRILWVGGY